MAFFCIGGHFWPIYCTCACVGSAYIHRISLRKYVHLVINRLVVHTHALGGGTRFYYNDHKRDENSPVRLP